MVDTIHTFEHNWKPVSDGDWVLPVLTAAHLRMTVGDGETAQIIKYCPECDLYLARVFNADGEPQLGLNANALIHGLDLFDR